MRPAAAAAAAVAGRHAGRAGQAATALLLSSLGTDST